jgi:hypothetical protein
MVSVKGSDCTPQQMESAREFFEQRLRGNPPSLADEAIVRIPIADLVRLIAWYGALRYEAGRLGIGGSFDAPAPLDVVEEP